MADKKDICAELIKTYYNLSAEYKTRSDTWRQVRMECDSLYCEIERIEKLLIAAGYEHIRADEFIERED